MIHPAILIRAAVRILPVCLLVTSASAADPGTPDDDLKELLAGICRKHDVPSLTVAVVRSDAMVATACSGVRKRGTDDAVELSDRHPLGSCTKSMTATLAAAAVEAGKIDWDTTISDVWPRADKEHVHPALRDVTLDDLLSHQSGLLSDLSGDDWLTFFAEKSSPPLERRRMLNLVLKRKPEHPRGEHHYSNLGYVVAAAMLETRYGESYERLMRRLVFQPLAMDSAHFRTLARAKKLKAPYLWGHRSDRTPIDPRVAGAENPSVYAPCGTVNVTIADYAKYAQWHLSRTPAPVLTDQDSLDHLHTGRVDSPSTGGKYGGGWIHLDTGFGRAMTHVGSNTNSYAVIWVLADRDFAAVACTNTGEETGFLACDEAISNLMTRYARSNVAD